MGNITYKDLGIENGDELKARKLDVNDPVIKEMIENAIRQQEEILKLKEWNAESMRHVINI